MFRITWACEGVPASAGHAAASDIRREFAEHRQHHNNVVCTFTNGDLILTVENDFDPEGLALMDEFSDCISAYIAELFDRRIHLVAAIAI